MLITGNITKNFSLLEMMNKESHEKVQLVLTPQNVRFAQMIQIMRDYYKKPMNVSSWYRTKTFNKSCGGSPNSAHLDGLAVDILVTDYSELTLIWRCICDEYRLIGGVNYYDNRMHFTNNENRFGYSSFQIRDKR